jgi:hypothetical protein
VRAADLDKRGGPPRDVDVGLSHCSYFAPLDDGPLKHNYAT